MRPGFRRAALLLLALAACSDLTGPGEKTPSLTLSAPTAGVVLDGDSVVVTGVAQDDRQVVRITAQAGSSAEVEIPIAMDRSVAFSGVVRDLPLGEFSLIVRAYDADGRVGEQTVTLSTRDASAPALSILTPTEGELAPRDSVTITGSASDERAVDSLSYSLDGAAAVPVSIEAGKAVSFAFTLRPAPGEHTLLVRARDAGGNTTEETIHFTTSAAKLTITSPAADTTVNALMVTVRGVLDSTVPVMKLTWSTNKGTEEVRCETSLNPGCSFSAFWADSLSPGENTIEVFAYDGSGRRIGATALKVNVSVLVKEYTLRYLGTLGGSNSQGAMLNDKNQVVGWAEDAIGRKHAFAWDGTRMLDVGRELGVESYATGINEGGELVGWFTTDCKRAFYYKLGQEGNPRLLVDGCGYQAWDINDAGTALVSLTVERGGEHVAPERSAYLLDGGGLHQLVTDESLAEVLRVNNRGQVLGQKFDNYWIRAPILLSTDAPPEILGICQAGDLNNLGHATIIRGCKSTDSQSNGFVAGKELVTIGRPGGTYAWGINDRDEAAGMYILMLRSSPAPRVIRSPFFWDGQRMAMVKYDDTDWTIDSVQDLNNTGAILAHAKNAKTGQQGAVLLVPKN